MSGKSSTIPMPFNAFVEASLREMGPKMPQLPSLPSPQLPDPFLPDDRPPNRPRQGAFKQLLSGEAGVLHSDSRERPELYDTRMNGILTDLVSGARPYDDLSEEERQLLDEATVRFATTPIKPKEQVRAQEQIIQRVVTKLAPAPPPPKPPAAPEHDLQPYWWLQEK